VVERSERPNGQSPRSAAHLQPGNGGSIRPIDQAILDELHCGGFVQDEGHEAEQAATRLAQLLAEQDMVENLRAHGFAGPRYEVLKATLVAYAFPVIRAWIRRREIYQFTADRGRAVRCPDEDRDHLARDEDDRLELAVEIVAAALPFFRKHALLNGKWNPEGGASLNTFFVGACLAVFPNIFRAWYREYRSWKKVQRYELDPALDEHGRNPLDVRHDGDPANTVVDMEMFRTGLASIRPAQLRQAVADVIFEGVPYREIARRLGTTEGAVKQMFFRYRQEALRRAERRKG
jgi:hypothetical protein